eukprot:CAMPEP_0177614770 /NCGR_PEP_ID=MMETSP0419_2-20121207/22950_1 /TAXON_ID=582737 /ORGANISM="Tetraselmis sp., Strain GSL018" /LENGTH=30 /DNA_ID= /DNA_START= /DNA_END= /DNA_ORIENTATION=
MAVGWGWQVASSSVPPTRSHRGALTQPVPP